MALLKIIAFTFKVDTLTIILLVFVVLAILVLLYFILKPKGEDTGTIYNCTNPIKQKGVTKKKCGELGGVFKSYAAAALLTPIFPPALFAGALGTCTYCK